MVCKGKLRCLATVWLVTSVAAQQLALDVNQGPFTGTLGYGSYQFGSSNGTWALFDGWSQDGGTEPWITDGTVAGTHLLRDLVPGPELSGPEPIQWVGNRLLLATRGFGLTRGHLWVTDGTPAGTMPVSDQPTSPGSFRGLGELQGRAIFGSMQLWSSDLTEAGTTQLASCQVVGTYVQSATVGNRIVFSGNGDAALTEPWVTDGTAAGTLRLADIHPTLASRPDWFTALGNHVYFLATNAADTTELWRTDGTPAGTQLVLTTPFVRSSLTTERLMRVGNSLLAILGGNLWRSDGTAAGTTQLLPAGTNTTRELLSDGTTAFAIYGSQLWRSDGTAAGTQFVIDLGALVTPPRGTHYRSFVHQGQLRLASFSYASDITTVIVSDGTAAGTTTADVTGVTIGLPLQLGNRMLLLGHGNLNNSAPRLAISDGTPAGTQTLWTATANAGNVPGKAVTRNGVLYTFLNDGVNGQELWRTDGTPGGTQMVADIYPGPDGGLTNNSKLVALDGYVYFTALSPATGMALWRSDGTTAGTTLVYDSYGAFGAPSQLQVSGHELYFTDFDPTNQFLTVLHTDGTPQGTTAVPGVQNTFQPGFGVLDGVVVYARFNQGLWRTDGTPAGTFALPGPAPVGCTNLGDRLVFFGYAGSNPPLWVTDGTVAGTQQLLAAVSGDATAGSLLPWRNGLARLSGTELIVTDGTPAGTTSTLLPLPSDPLSYAFAENRLYVVAEDAAHGRELWQSDGTVAGTVRVTDLAPGFQHGVASVFATPLGDRVLLSASNGLDGLEPYVSDGTAAGTVRLADLSPLGSSNPQFLGVADDRVFYLADDGTTGPEPGSLPIASILNPALEPLGVGCPGTAGLPELTASKPRLGTTLVYTVQHARDFAPCLFALAVGTARTVLPSGCVLQVGSGAVVVFTAADGNGTAQQSLALPLDPALAGLRLGAQTLVLDPFGSALPGLAASQGLLAVLGL